MEKNLILIALIVLILGNAEQKELGDQIEALRAEVKSLQSSIEHQSRQIMELKTSLDAHRAQPDDESRPR